MKRILLFALSFVFVLSAFSQGNASEEIDPRLYLGFNFGLSNQKSDVNDKFGIGTGILLEGHLIKNETSLLGLSVRGRWLFARMTGQDYVASYNIANNSALDAYYPSPGYTFHNYKTNIHEGAVELAVYANKLRANTGMLLYGFGGLNSSSYLTRTNLTGTFGSTYNYAGIDPNDSKAEIKQQLNLIMDQSAESETDGNFGWNHTFNPSLGFGIGLEAGPRLHLTWEHKVNFTPTDVLDGNRWATNTALSSNNDRYYYTSFNFNIGLGGGNGHVSTNVHTNNTNNTNVNTNYTDVSAPIITLISPTFIQSENCYITAEAYVYNIESTSQVSITKNGTPLPTSEYRYNHVNKILTISTNVNSHETLKIIAQNIKGKATQKIYLECDTRNNDHINDVPKVSVNITNPTTEYSLTPDGTVVINATIKNAEQHRIKLEVNGQETPFHYSNQILTKKLMLQEGINYIVVKASNATSSDKDQVRIEYKKANQSGGTPPIIDITTPNVSPYEEADNQIAIEADVKHLDRSEIKVEFDGQEITGYSLTNDVLKTSVNVTRDATFSISGANAYGSARDILFLRKTSTQITQGPTITFINPVKNGYTSTQKSFEVKAKIERALVHDIGVKVDGKTVLNWKFSNQTLTLPLQLSNVNNVTITVDGNSGLAEDSRTIYYNPGQPAPTVDIFDPRGNPYETIMSKTSVRARITNADRDEITVYINDVEQHDWQFINNIVVQEVIISGTKEIKVIADNGVGSSEDRVTIKEKGSILKPSIILYSPLNNTYTSTNCFVRIDAKIRNATENDVTVKINGTPTNQYEYINDHVIMDVNYENNWTVTIGVKTTGGKDSETITLGCNSIQNTPSPEVQFIKPVNDRYTSTDCSTEFKALVKNVQHQDISVFVNDQRFNNWTLSADVVTFNLSHTGETTVKIAVSNQGGKDSDLRTVYCNPPRNEPEVDIITPSSSNFNSANCTVQLKARVSHVEAENIQVTLNNSPVEFTFNGTFVEAQVSYRTNAQLKVIGSNDFGRDEDAVTLTCSRVVTPKKPEVTITKPTTTRFTTTNCNYTVKAVIKNAQHQHINVFVNNQSVSNWTISAGIISVPVRIQGSASVSITAKNNAGKASATVELFCTTLRKEPKVELVTPTRTTYETSNCNANIRMRVSNAEVDQISVTLGGAPIAFDFNGTYIDITTKHKNNQTIKVTAQNDMGRDSKSILLKCASTTALLPDVEITSPSTSTYSSTKCKTTIKAQIKNARHSDITVFVNNKSVSNWTLSAGTLTMPISFSGRTSVEISIKNAGGKSSDRRTLICEEVIVAPNIDLINPNSNAYSSSDCKINLKAKVLNAVKSDIRVKLNGISKPFYMSGNLITAQFTYKKGDKIEITASNSGGTAREVISLSCNPVVKPTLRILSPPNNPWSSPNCEVNLTAKVTGVIKSQISVTLNGRPISFTYNGTVVHANKIKYTHGSILKVSATNAAGTVSDQRTLNCKPKQTENKPIVTFISPARSPFLTSNCRVNVVARVSDVKSKSQITVTVNGKTINNYTLSGGQISFATNTTRSTIIKITARNSAGSSSKTVTVQCNASNSGGPK